MDIRLGSKNARKAEFEGVEDRIRDAVASEKEVWEYTLSLRPDRFESIERDVHKVFQGLADQVVAGLLSAITQKREFETSAKK